MKPPISFGDWIRTQRKALDLTQQQLADRVGCSLSAVKKIESDARRPSRQVAGLLAEALSVPPERRALFLEVARGLKQADRLSPPQEPIQPVPRSSLPTGTVTFLFTDMEGSTQLWAQSPQAMKSAHARHDRILRDAIAASHGYVFRVLGDAIYAAFDTAVDALDAAVQAQGQLHAESWGETPIRVRMGIHTGEAELQPDDLYAGYLTLSYVQRLMSAAAGGQVLLSFTSRELVQDKLPEGVELRDMGRRRLKDWDEPEHIFQLLIPGLPVDFPPLKTPEESLHNLPIQLTSFIGRHQELAETSALLSGGRLLSLVGQGGIGKTRLALQLAGAVRASFAEGAWMVELAPLTDGDSVARVVAAVLGLRELPRLPLLDIISDHLRPRQLLLILDNCEHLVAASAELGDHLLRSCPEVKIVVTSREALGISGEIIYRVPPLSLPGESMIAPEAAMGFESVRLFAERAAAANPKFHLAGGNAGEVVEICRRLDGIPLALELAAARTGVFSLEEIAARLDQRFRLLADGNRLAPERHQTLRALIDWSYDLLAEEERALFRPLSVFAGGWTFEAAEAVCPGLDVFGLLPQLVNKSLVMAEEQADGMRYHMLETIRQYAGEKLLQEGEADPIGARHAQYFLEFAQAAEPNFNSPSEMEWILRLETEHDNLRAALEWALEHDPTLALRLIPAIYLFWSRHGHDVEGSRILRRALERFRTLPPVEGPAARERIALQVKALNALGVLGFGLGNPAALQAFQESAELARQIGEKSGLSTALSHIGASRAFRGDVENAYPAAREGLVLARELGDKVLVGGACLNMAAVISLAAGDAQEAEALADEGLQLLRETGAHWLVAMGLLGAGLFANRRGEYAEARSRFEACLPLMAEMGDPHRLNMVHSEIAHIERHQGKLREAQSHYRETLLEWQRLGHRAAVAHELECLAFVAKMGEEDTRAATLLGAAEILRESIDIPMTPVERLEYQRELKDLRTNMDPSEFARAWADGRGLTMEQAIALAIGDRPGT